MTDSDLNAKLSARRRRWLLLFAIIAANVIFNLLVSDRNKSDWIQRIIIGIAIVQPILFAAWAAIGPPPAVKRVPLTITALFAVEMASTVRDAADNRSLPYLELLLVTFALFLGSAIVFWIVRILSRWVVTDQFAEADIARSQFSLRYLIGLTTITALLLGLGRIFAMVDSSTANFPLSDALKEIAMPIGLMLLAAIPAVIVPLLILSHPPGIRSIVVLAVLWLVLSGCGVGLIAAFETQTLSEAAVDVVGFQIGAVAAGALVGAMLRFAGYRLLKRHPQFAGT